MPGTKQELAPTADDKFRLHPSQVPEYPTSIQWVCLLRWCIAVMDATDRDIGFAASLLYYASDKGGLTEKQAKHGQRLIDRVHALWLAEALECQRNPRSSAHSNLGNQPAEGGA